MIELVDDSLIVFLILQYRRTFRNIFSQLIVQTSCQNSDFGILIQTVIIRKTPNHLDIRVQFIKEGINFSHLPHKDRVLAGSVDIEKDALGITDIAAIEQRRV